MGAGSCWRRETDRETSKNGKEVVNDCGTVGDKLET